MTLTFSPGTDFEDVCDGLEGITLTKRDTTQLVISSALRRAVRQVEGGGEGGTSGGDVQVGDVYWHLPVSQMASEPELGATITDDESRIWTILEVEEQTLSRRWRCLTREFSIREATETLITIQRATFSKGTHGESTPTWSNWQTNVRAKIQPLNDLRIDGKAYDVWLSTDYALGARHRFKDSNNVIYNIISIEAYADIARMQRVICEITPNPFGT